jgi:hypothetical protein
MGNEIKTDRYSTTLMELYNYLSFEAESSNEERRNASLDTQVYSRIFASCKWINIRTSLAKLLKFTTYQIH